MKAGVCPQVKNLSSWDAGRSKSIWNRKCGTIAVTTIIGLMSSYRSGDCSKYFMLLNPFDFSLDPHKKEPWACLSWFLVHYDWMLSPSKNKLIMQIFAFPVLGMESFRPHEAEWMLRGKKVICICADFLPFTPFRSIPYPYPSCCLTHMIYGLSHWASRPLDSECGQGEASAAQWEE